MIEQGFIKATQEVRCSLERAILVLEQLNRSGLRPLPPLPELPRLSDGWDGQPELLREYLEEQWLHKKCSIK